MMQLGDIDEQVAAIGTVRPALNVGERTAIVEAIGAGNTAATREAFEEAKRARFKFSGSCSQLNELLATLNDPNSGTRFRPIIAVDGDVHDINT